MQKQLAYKCTSKKHFKFVTMTSEETASQLGWEAEHELNGTVNNSELIVMFRKEA